MWYLLHICYDFDNVVNPFFHVVEVEIEALQRLNEYAIRVRKLRELEDTAERATPEAKIVKEVEEIPVSGPPRASQKHIDRP